MAFGYGIRGVIAICNDCLFQCDATDEVGLRIVLEKHSYDSGLIQLLKRFFKSNDAGTFIDIGAHIGLIIVPVAKLSFVECRGYEPSPVNFRLLEKNVATNDVVGSVTLKNIAVSDRDGHILMELSPDSSGDHRIRQEGPIKDGLFNEAARQELRVTTAKLDSDIDCSALTGPVVIKVDVQGAEPLVFKGATKLIQRSAFVVMEYWPYGIDRLGISIDDYLHDIESLFQYGVLLTEERYREHFESNSLLLEPIGIVSKRLKALGTRDTYFDVLLSHVQKI
jgi:FkbM family methyltransferase